MPRLRAWPFAATPAYTDQFSSLGRESRQTHARPREAATALAASGAYPEPRPLDTRFRRKGKESAYDSKWSKRLACAVPAKSTHDRPPPIRPGEFPDVPHHLRGLGDERSQELQVCILHYLCNSGGGGPSQRTSGFERCPGSGGRRGQDSQTSSGTGPNVGPGCPRVFPLETLDVAPFGARIQTASC